MLVSPLKGGIGSLETGGSRRVSPVTGGRGERETGGDGVTVLGAGCTEVVSSRTVSMCSFITRAFAGAAEVSPASGFLSTHDTSIAIATTVSEIRARDIIDTRST